MNLMIPLKRNRWDPDEFKNIQTITLHALHNLGGSGEIADLRFQTKFKYTGKRLVDVLSKLRNIGKVKYIKQRRSGNTQGYWQIT